MFHYIEKYVIALGLIGVFVVLAAVWFLIKRLPGAIGSALAKSWPLADGQIETVNVRTLGEQALVELGYSYCAGGTRYSGYFSQQFADEQQAWDYAKKLKDRPILVRHKGSDPALSVLRIQDQQSCSDFRGSSPLTAVRMAFLSAGRELYSSRQSEERYPR
jgi:hypothetical protein